MAYHGSNLDVDGTAEQLTSTSNPVTYGVSVKADPGNSDNVYVGLSSGVTAGSNGATDGYVLDAGEEVFIPVIMADDTDEIWVIGGAANQKVFWIGV